MQQLLPLIPILVVIVLLVRGIRPVVAAVWAYLSSLSLLLLYPVSRSEFWQSHTVALELAAEVSAILLGGIALDELTRRSGHDIHVGNWLQDIAPDRSSAVLLIVLGFTPFFGSVTGFGVGAQIATTLLRTLGLSKLGILFLLGLIAVPWGALAPGTLVAARLAGVSFQSLGVLSALLSLPLFLLSSSLALYTLGGLSAIRLQLLLLLRGCLTLWVGITLSNFLFGTPLVGALGSVMTIVTLGELWRPQRFSRQQIMFLSPYIVLVVLLISGRILALPLTATHPTLSWILAHPALALGLTTAWVWQQNRSTIRSRLRRSEQDHHDAVSPRWTSKVLQRWVPVALTTLLFLFLGHIFATLGVTSNLADLLSKVSRWALISTPWLGELGGYVTGSNTGSNALFAELQAQIATTLGLSPLFVVALQNVAASFATMASPMRLSLIWALLRPTERDPAIARVILLVVCFGLALLSLIAFGLALAAGNLN